MFANRVPGNDDPAVHKPVGELHGFIDLLDRINGGLRLLDLQDRSYREIAGALGITEPMLPTKTDAWKTV